MVAGPARPEFQEEISKMSDQENFGLPPEINEQLDALFISFPVTEKRNRKARLVRFYDVTVRDGEEIINKFENVNSYRASKIKKYWHEHGFLVDMIETSTRDAHVDPVSYPPDPTYSPSDPNIPKPIYTPHRKVNQSNQNMIARLRDLHYRRENTRLAKEAKRSESIKVYEKASGKLCFSGDLDSAVEYCYNKIQSGEWKSLADFTIYIPEKIYQKVVK
jgi:hypothetical protein